jgi:iron(III) transport system ATP-binding protein
LFTAEFMGSNNRLTGKLAEMRDGFALLAGRGWNLWGEARSAAREGADATGMIRLERVKLVDGPGENRILAPLVTSMYLGDRWEHLFSLGEASLRAYGNVPLAPGDYWLDLPRSDLWVF